MNYKAVIYRLHVALKVRLNDISSRLIGVMCAVLKLISYDFLTCSRLINLPRYVL